MSAIGLPVSQLITVNVSLTPPAAQAPNLNSALIIGSSPVIDVTTRIREYGDIEEVSADFGTTDPEYLAASLFFGQSPQPNQLFIGRWAETATAGLLETGVISATNQLPATWTGITSGNFFVIEDGVPRAISGMNFATIGNMNAVASVIQTALQGQEAGSTCVWDAEEQQFVISSGSTGAASSVSFLQSPTAVGNAAFSGNPANNDTLTLNGSAITFVTSGATGNQVNIGGTLAITLTSLAALINGSSDTQISKFKALVSGTTLYVYAATAGTGGNALTLAKSSTVITLSGATLSGATGTDISSLLSGQSTQGGLVVQGIAAEQPVAAVQALDSLQQYWYLCTFASKDLTNSQVEAVAGYIEAANNKHQYGVTSQDPNCLNANSTTDIAYLLKSLGYNRTFVQYSSTNPYAAASWLGRAVTVNFTGSNTVINMMYQQEPGVIGEYLTVAQAAALQNKNANVFVNYNNNTVIIQYGTNASGIYFDIIQDTDWLAYQIQNQLFNLLYGAGTKIPQTDAGNHQLLNTIVGVCEQGVANGTIAPGTWNAPGFGQISEGDYLPTGYYVYVPPIYTQTEAARQTRASVPIQVAIKLAGAIDTVNVSLNVNQ